MNLDLDDLFDTRPRQEQMKGPSYIPPPPPSDPPPPLVTQQDPFGNNIPLPPLPPPPPPISQDVPTPPSITSSALPYHVNYANYHATPPYNNINNNNINNNNMAYAVPPPSPPQSLLPQHQQQQQHALYHSTPTSIPPPPISQQQQQVPYQTSMQSTSFPSGAQQHVPYQNIPVVASDNYTPNYQQNTGSMVIPSSGQIGSNGPILPYQGSPGNETATLNPKSLSSTLTQEEEDKKQLEKIIQLRKELEKERERERKKREELETWGCPSCTFRNALDVNQCGMCETKRPGYNPPPNIDTTPVTRGETGTLPTPPLKSNTSSSRVAGPTAWLCSICLAPNEAHHTRCKLCNSYQKNGTPIPAGDAKTSAIISNATRPPTAWLCSICGKKNGAKDARCGACNSYQSNGTPIMEHEAPQVLQAITEVTPTSWKCSVCTLENSISNALCEACQSGQRPRHLAPPKGKGHEKQIKRTGGEHTTHSSPKTWPCPTCTYQNVMNNEKCEMCSTGRPSQFKPVPQTSSGSGNKDNDDAADDIQWQDDTVATECNRCRQPFNLTRRRHHCRACGFVFCGTCSPFQMVVKRNGPLERVCVSCYEAHK